MLGERIRKLRKQKKMTLEELAGETLTKGMLSLIENSKANPSMESLHYIAERLEVEVSDLLEEISSQEFREILDLAEELYNQKKIATSEAGTFLSEKDKEIIDLIQPYIPNLTQGYESARLLDIYSRSLYNEKIAGWEKLSEHAANLYDQMNLTSRRASIGIFRAQEKFYEHDYELALTIFLSERAIIEKHHAYIDPNTRLDLDYYEAILFFAVGNTDSALRVMNRALAFSKENRIFIQIDNLYRLAAGHAMMENNEEKKMYYSLKLKQYGDFADDQYSILFYHFMVITSLISVSHQYEKAIEQIDYCLSDPVVTDNFKYHFYVEKGKALYWLERYDEALEYLNKIKIPSIIHHPFDLSILYIKDTYKALCYMKQNNWNKANQFAKQAVQNFEPLPKTLLKELANETFDFIDARNQEDGFPAST